MLLTIHALMKELEQQGAIGDWSPEASTRPLRSVEGLSLPSAEDQAKLIRSPNPQDQLYALAGMYQGREYQKIRTFFRSNPDRLGNEGKLLLLLAYLGLFRDQETPLSKHVVPLADDLAEGEPSEFGTIRDWLKSFLQGRDLPPEFFQRAGIPKESR